MMSMAKQDNMRWVFSLGKFSKLIFHHFAYCWLLRVVKMTSLNGLEKFEGLRIAVTNL